MKRLISGALVLLGLWGSSAGATQVEELLKKPLPYWETVNSQFFRQAAEDAERENFNAYPVGSQMMEYFTQVAGAYDLSVKEIEKLYRSAVKLAVVDALNHMATACRLPDPDVAIPFQEISDSAELFCGREVEEFVRKNAHRYLKGALSRCNLLSYSPLVSSLVGRPGCSWFCRYFPRDVKRELFRFLSREEAELPGRVDGIRFKELRETYLKLKEAGLL